MDALQASSGTVKSLDDTEELIKSSVEVCLKWLRWLIERSNGKKKKRGGARDVGVKWASYLTKNRNDDDDDYDEDLENEYGEEIALQKYGAAKVYERIMW